jgi:hypothetical protein
VRGHLVEVDGCTAVIYPSVEEAEVEIVNRLVI